jgi:hypothetical protein
VGLVCFHPAAARPARRPVSKRHVAASTATTAISNHFIMPDFSRSLPGLIYDSRSNEANEIPPADNHAGIGIKSGPAGSFRAL